MPPLIVFIGRSVVSRLVIFEDCVDCEVKIVIGGGWFQMIRGCR